MRPGQIMWPRIIIIIIIIIIITVVNITVLTGMFR